MSVRTAPQSESQYSLVKILGIWALAAAPMAVLAWVVYAALVPDFASDLKRAGTILTALMMVGLMWQFVLAMIIIYREEGDLRWATIARRGRLNTPRNPRTGESQKRLLLWCIPLVIVSVVLMFFVLHILNNLWVTGLPFLAQPPSLNMDSVLGVPEVQAQLVGAWGFAGLFLVMSVFTYMGEEFLFRGVLLPKMNGRFGKWDWVANGFLFGTYHWHQPWMIPGGIITGIFMFALPAKFFHSTWMSIIVHSWQSLFFMFLILGIVLGLA
jgi:membrane protease YdiL (CAAX protease family)